MGQYIVVFPTIGDSFRDYPRFPLSPLALSYVLNYETLQHLTYRFVTNCCPEVELFLPTKGGALPYRLCNTLKEVDDTVLNWKQHCLPLVVLPPYLLELSHLVVAGSRFSTTAIMEIFEIKVELYPLRYKLVTKWKKPISIVQRERSASTKSWSNFIGGLLNNRDRSDTQ